MPEQRSPNVIQVNLRMTKDLHKRLVREAKRARRSLNQEMVLRLEQTFQRVAADAILEQARSMKDGVEQLYRDMVKRSWAPREQYRSTPLPLETKPATMPKRGRIKEDDK